MSHFLDRLTFFRRTVDTFADGHGIVTNEDRDWEESYRARWQHDKVVRSTHGVNCTGSCSWKIYVKGGIITWETQQTDYPRTRPDLPNHEPRGLFAGGELFLVHLQRQPAEIPAGAQPAGAPLAGGAQDHGAGRRLGLDRRGRRDPPRLPARARARRLRPLRLGRGQRDRRRGQCLHHQDARAGPGHRVLADPRHVDGLLRRRLALSVADRRRLHELLRLVLRPAAVEPADLGRADRRARKRRLVQFDLPDDVGLERAADADPRRPFHDRGALQGRHHGHGDAGLQRGVEIRRYLAQPQAGHRRRAGAGDGPRDPQRMASRGQERLFRGLLPALHRHAAAGDPARDRWRLGARPHAARGRPGGRAGHQANNPEWKTVAIDETRGDALVCPVGSIGFPLGRAGQVEHRGEGRFRRRGHPAQAQPDRHKGRCRPGRLPLFRQYQPRPFPRHRP